ncbi:MAG TPA: MotA/TolQ/ExbB proton channel family protein [Kofleriaceae bacterium]|nr:MotA/TolQ/ExbB proton channel family protein [Kofleriaceae bacterium]
MHDKDTIDATILDLMLRAGSRWVLWLLLGLSVAAVAVMIERLWFYLQERRPRAALAAALDALRRTGPADALARLAGVRSMEAAVARACLERAGDGPAVADEQRAAAAERERERYERRLAFLGTLGNNAPFIGLFGTVLGIVRAFHDLGGATLQGTQAVMNGIAQALVATGVGLVVALPAVATYNAFVRHVERTTSSADATAHEILAQLKRPAGREAA